MKKEAAKRWAEALESGEYEQAKYALCENGKYCCLGVLCEMAVKDGAPIEVTMRHQHKVFDGETRVPPHKVYDFYNIGVGASSDRKLFSKLVEMNDTENRSFTEIAEAIRVEYDVPKVITQEEKKEDNTMIFKAPYDICWKTYTLKDANGVKVSDLEFIKSQLNAKVVEPVEKAETKKVTMVEGYALYNKETSEYLKRGKSVRIYKRKCDASNSRNEKGLDRNVWESKKVEFVLS